MLERKLDVYPSVALPRSGGVLHRGSGSSIEALDAANDAIDVVRHDQDVACIACPLGYDIRAAVHLARNDRVAAITDLETGAGR